MMLFRFASRVARLRKLLFFEKIQNEFKAHSNMKSVCVCVQTFYYNARKFSLIFKSYIVVGCFISSVECVLGRQCGESKKSHF